MYFALKKVDSPGFRKSQAQKEKCTVDDGNLLYPYLKDLIQCFFELADGAINISQFIQAEEADSK